MRREPPPAKHRAEPSEPERPPVRPTLGSEPAEPAGVSQESVPVEVMAEVSPTESLSAAVDAQDPPAPSEQKRELAERLRSERATSPQPASPATIEPEEITIVAGSPDADEVAALTAVIIQAVDELASDRSDDQPSAVSAWQRSRRALRTPLAHGAGVWRGFSG